MSYVDLSIQHSEFLRLSSTPISFYNLLFKWSLLKQSYFLLFNISNMYLKHVNVRDLIMSLPPSRTLPIASPFSQLTIYHTASLWMSLYSVFVFSVTLHIVSPLIMVKLWMSFTLFIKKVIYCEIFKLRIQELLDIIDGHNDFGTSEEKQLSECLGVILFTYYHENLLITLESLSNLSKIDSGWTFKFLSFLILTSLNIVLIVSSVYSG